MTPSPHAPSHPSDPSNPSPSTSAPRAAAARPRLLVAPGLHGGGSAHWLTWLEAQFPGALRVEQAGWDRPDLAAWAERVAATLEEAGPGPHALVAHSFGCLAALHLLQRAGQGDGARLPASAAAAHAAGRIAELLLVAPADPLRFAAAGRLPQGRIDVPTCVVASDTDPWMTATSARAWALRWGSDWINLGDAGHINVAAGFGPFPLARDWVHAALRRLAPPPAIEGFDARPWRVAA
jgi:predicted alpha/beta hydrolase family esterase